MTRLELTAGDTKPTVCTLAQDLTGSTIHLNIGYPVPLVKSAVITDAAAGDFEFRWTAGDLVAGTYSASMLITDSNGYEETTALFQIHIEGRIA